MVHLLGRLFRKSFIWGRKLPLSVAAIIEGPAPDRKALKAPFFWASEKMASMSGTRWER